MPLSQSSRPTSVQSLSTLHVSVNRPYSVPCAMVASDVHDGPKKSKPCGSWSTTCNVKLDDVVGTVLGVVTRTKYALTMPPLNDFTCAKLVPPAVGVYVTREHRLLPGTMSS